MIETLTRNKSADPSLGEAPSGPAAVLVRWLWQVVPTVLVLSALGGIAAWGHRTGWKMPAFSSLVKSEQKVADDWCKEHSVRESECVECQPLLWPKGKEFGWCRIHGIPECPLEHPEVAQLSETATVSPSDLARAQRALDFAARPENSNKCKLHLRRIQFASNEAVDKAGIEVQPVWPAPMAEYIVGNGEITYDPTRVVTLSTPVPGRVWRVEREVGHAVRQGDLLVLVDAAEVGKAKAEFLQALVEADLKAKTLESLREAGRGVAGRLIVEAEAALNVARARLVSAQQSLINLGLPVQADEVKGLGPEEIGRRMQFLGLPDALTQALDPRTTTGNLVPVRAALDGVIITRTAAPGTMVDATKNLFVVADVRHMWLTLYVRQEDAAKPALGQTVRFRPAAGAAEITAKVNWISTDVDEKTRTLKVRADLVNPEGRLRANTFGTGRIVLREEPEAVVVPNEAVHWEGDCNVVFVRDKDYHRAGAPKVFHVRKVRVGARDETNTEIIAGLLPRELVATKGSGTLRSELLKNNLGAG